MVINLLNKIHSNKRYYSNVGNSTVTFSQSRDGADTNSVNRENSGVSRPQLPSSTVKTLENDLLYKHTGLVLAVLKNFKSTSDIDVNLSTAEVASLKYPKLSRLTEEKTTDNKAYLKLQLQNSSNSSTDEAALLKPIFLEYRGVFISHDHLQFMTDILEENEYYNNAFVKAFTTLLFIPYLPGNSVEKGKSAKVEQIFELDDYFIYTFYKKLFEDQEVQNALLKYLNYVRQNVYDPALVHYNSTQVKNDCFLTWIRVKGKGSTHENKYNTNVHQHIIPSTERHVHLFLMLDAIFHNWPARCYTNADQVSIVRLVFKKCFKTSLNRHKV